MADTKTVTVTSPTDIQINGLTAGPARGWTWDPADSTLRHPASRNGFRLTPSAAARLTAALAAAVPARTERQPGAALAGLTASERAEWTWTGDMSEGAENGIYVKYTPAVPATLELHRADVTLVR